MKNPGPEGPALREHPIGMRELLPFDPVNPKHEILKIP
jgi:hypothetical protein